MDTTMIWKVAGAVITSLGGSVAIILACSSWLGKVWATRIADAEKAKFAEDLERYRNELHQLAEERQDALTRKRDVYGRLAASMRVFLRTGTASTAEDKRAFETAFDHAALWASEEVAKTIGSFLELSTRHTADRASVSNDEFKDAYRSCMNAMRRDCGFPDTTFNYPVVTFL